MESKELGLVLGEQLLGLESLHYGYWEEYPQSEEAYTLLEIIKAQKNYTYFLSKEIEKELKKIKKPPEQKKILDVGCGTGEMLLHLLEKKYSVDGLIPSKNLQERVEKKLQTNQQFAYKSRIYNCNFENILSESQLPKYDLIFFSESFQYIPMKDSFAILPRILNKNGIVVICDFFKKIPHRTKDLHLVGGGHLWGDFEKMQAISTLQKIREIDITKKVSPTIEVGSYLLHKRIFSSAQLVNDYLKVRLQWKYSLLQKLLQFIGKKEFAKFQKKYLLGERTGANYEKHNKYAFLVFQKTGEK
jgi:ubiquinone/menaquinone biosynthesis C-methylase UbiE